MNYIVNTNKNKMELFAVVADMQGEGLPLSYLFITTEENAAPLTKQSALIEWMKGIRSLGIDPRFTLSDKDQSEINALKEVWPCAKHQLCLWHVLRALKRRLSQNENPGSYNALEAHHVFPVIDPAFLPLGQMRTEEKVRNDDLLTISCSSWLYRVLCRLLLGCHLPESAC